MSEIRVGLLALAFGLGCATPQAQAPAPGRAALWGELHTLPHEDAPAPPPDGSAYADRRLGDARRVDYSQPGFAVVYLDTGGSPGGALDLRIASGRVAARLEPRHGVVGAGGEIALYNEDRSAHVISAPALGLVRKLAPGAVLRIPAEAPGELVVHLLDGGSEASTVLVVAGPYAQVGPTGAFALPDLPPGRYALRAWHPRLPPWTREVELAPDRRDRVDIELGVGRGATPPVDTPGWTVPDWARRVRLSGSASAGYFHRGDASPRDSDAFQIWDARLFVDADLAGELDLAGRPVLRNVGFSFEWNLVRLGSLQNEIGDLYVDFQGLGRSPWLNAQLGRFQIPVGENYLRFGRGYRDNPFISNTVGGPWWWDEGVRIYGGADHRFGYLASLTGGETPFNQDANSDPQVTLKLFADPTDWLHVSASGLYSGEVGSNGSPAHGALWLGESWARAFGSGSGVPNTVGGVEVPDGPNVLQRTWLVGLDAVLRPFPGSRVWLAGGRYAIDSAGPGLYDRALVYWIAEWITDLSPVSAALAPFYVGVRANGITTADRSRGYLLNMRHASTLGYNMVSLDAYSAVAGVRLGRFVVVRSEYTYQHLEVVRGASAPVRAAADPAHVVSFDVGIHF